MTNEYESQLGFSIGIKWLVINILMKIPIDFHIFREGLKMIETTNQM